MNTTLSKDDEIRSKRTASVLENTSEGLAESIDFEKGKGNLPWPTNGVLVGTFGTHTIPGTRVQDQNNGIDISPAVGAAVRSVANGVVTGVIDDEGTGDYTIIIRHGKYFTSYSNIRNPTVKKGSEVRGNTVIGSAGQAFDGPGGFISFNISNDRSIFLNRNPGCEDDNSLKDILHNAGSKYCPHFFSSIVKKQQANKAFFEHCYLCKVMFGNRIISKKSIGVSWALALTIISNLVNAQSYTADSSSNTTTVPKQEFKSLLPAQQTTNSSDKNVHTALNPQVIGFKNEYVKREQHEMTRMKDWGRPYFHIYDKILSEYHLPLELKYLSVIESSLQSGMRSWAGAVGPWQLMYDEAMRFGLKVGDGVDERMDYQKSTVVAAKLLTELHQQFGDWLLVIAAYNAGPGAVRKAKRKAGSDDFWKLQYYLPLETRNHVKKFISTHYFFEGSGGITTMTKNETKDFNENNLPPTPTLTEEDKKNTTTYQLTGFYDGSIICKKLGIPQTLFDKLNPGLNKVLANGKAYELRLPTEKMALFQKDKNEILAECFQQLLKE